MKTISTLIFFSLFWSTGFASTFFPGSTLEILEDAKAVRIEDRMIASPLLTYAIFTEGKNVMSAPAYNASTEFCLIVKDSQTPTLKGRYFYNGFSFTQYEGPVKSLDISCFKTRLNSYNSKYIPQAVILDENIITRALGGFGDLKITTPESFKVGNYTFTTGTKEGQEVYGPKKCSLHTFKVGNQVKMLFAGGTSSCSMNVESWSMQNTSNRGEVLKLQGKGIFIGVETKCSLEFEVLDGKLTGRALQNIKHNNSGSYCQY